MQVEFFFDPVCPWCWITSRWIEEVRSRREDVAVRWRPFSLLLKNEGSIEERWRAQMEAGHRMLRVISAAGDTSAGDLYTTLGTAIHHDEIPPQDVDIAAAVDALGLAPELARAAEDERLDSPIRASMGEALRLAGDDVGVPLISFDGRAAYFGPVMAPAPTGERALELFDALSALVAIPGFYELKRTRDHGPLFGPRPEVPVALRGQRRQESRAGGAR